MKPIRFPESNIELGKPASMTDAECGSLPVFTDGKQCISLWQLTWKERFQIFFFGRIWLGVLSGQTQPPVWMDTQRTMFEQKNATGLTWFNLHPNTIKIGKFSVKLFNLFCRFTSEPAKYFGFGLLQINAYHLFYIGREDRKLKLSILFTNFEVCLFKRLQKA